MTALRELLPLWERVCERKRLPELLAEGFVPEAAHSQAARLGREHLLACALDPWDADEVLSEIALLSIDDEGEETWLLRRLSGPQAAAIAGGRLSAHFAKSFIHATWRRSVPTARSGRRANASDPR